MFGGQFPNMSASALNDLWAFDSFSLQFTWLNGYLTRPTLVDICSAGPTWCPILPLLGRPVVDTTKPSECRAKV